MQDRLGIFPRQSKHESGPTAYSLVPLSLTPLLGREREVIAIAALLYLPVRQQTLRATMHWSYHLLGPPEQRLFRWLAIFEGGCTLEAVAAVCDASDDLGIEVLEGVASLLDKSLLRQTEHESEEPRLLLLETIREYEVERLKAEHELEALQHAHSAYYLALAEEIGDLRFCAAGLELLASTADVAGQGERAARLLRALRETLGAPQRPQQQAEVEQAVAFAAGRALSLELALAEALKRGAP